MILSQMNFWPTFSSKGSCILKCSECQARGDIMIHYPLDSGPFLQYNDRGWLLCKQCVKTVGPSKREAVYKVIKEITNRKDSNISYWFHCLPFPCDQPFDVIRSDDSISRNCTLLAHNAYFHQPTGEWVIIADLGENLSKTLSVFDWEKANPSLISTGTRFFTTGSMFKPEDASLLDI